MELRPNPGSDRAIDAGCICPVLDNHHGWGSDYGKDQFWIDGDCPVHAEEAKRYAPDE